MANGSGLSYVYVGAGKWTGGKLGGLFRQAVGDSQWEALTKGLPEQTSVQAITVHPGRSGRRLRRHPRRPLPEPRPRGELGAARLPRHRQGSVGHPRPPAKSEGALRGHLAGGRLPERGRRRHLAAAAERPAARAGEDGVRLSRDAPGRGPQSPRRGLRGAGGRGRHAQPRRRRDLDRLQRRAALARRASPPQEPDRERHRQPRACSTPTRSA